MPFDISKYLPGFAGNTAAAEGNISQLLSGQSSTAPARKKAAYFGATSGMPNSGVSNALGYSLYGEDEENNKQRGFDQLLKLITGYSGNAFVTPGQQLQADESQRNFDERRRESALARVDAERQLAERNKPKKYGFTMLRGPGASSVPGGFQNREWWA